MSINTKENIHKNSIRLGMKTISAIKNIQPVLKEIKIPNEKTPKEEYNYQINKMKHRFLILFVFSHIGIFILNYSAPDNNQEIPVIDTINKNFNRINVKAKVYIKTNNQKKTRINIYHSRGHFITTGFLIPRENNEDEQTDDNQYAYIEIPNTALTMFIKNKDSTYLIYPPSKYKKIHSRRLIHEINI